MHFIGMLLVLGFIGLAPKLFLTDWRVPHQPKPQKQVEDWHVVLRRVFWRVGGVVALFGFLLVIGHH
jgi:hypothetical protein